MRQILITLISVCLWVGACTSTPAGEGGVTPEMITRDPIPVNAPRSTPTTYYVRPDGGSAIECSGLVNAALNANAPDCAWNHPFQALPPQGMPRIQGGDTLFIASGSYMLGYGAPGTEACEAEGAYDCHMPPLPSGLNAEQPTRLLGESWDRGCTQPPELWGSQRPWHLIDLSEADHVEVGCLEITDHSDCVEDHSGGLACVRDDYPFGDWAPVGIHARDSADVYLHDLDIHGLASTGIHAGRLRDWRVEDVRVAANGWAGWDGDLWDDGEDTNAGTLFFRRWVVEWNGCSETYPGGEPVGCWAQTAGGYGDGVGTGSTGGDWIIEDSIFRYNTSDGLDLLYHTLGGRIELRRVRAEGNAGDQIKTSGTTHIENVLAVSNCGFFSGQPFTHHVDPCRAGGTALAFTFTARNQKVEVVNATVTGEGDCLTIAEGEQGEVVVQNSIFLGNPEFEGDGDVTCLAWYGTSTDPYMLDHILVYGVKGAPQPCPPQSFCNLAPGFVNNDVDAFDGRLRADSPAIDMGDIETCPPVDIEDSQRPADGDGDGQAQCDLGAYERQPAELSHLFHPLTLGS